MQCNYPVHAHYRLSPYAKAEAVGTSTQPRVIWHEIEKVANP